MGSWELTSKPVLVLTSLCLIVNVGYMILLLSRASILEEYAIQETDTKIGVPTMQPKSLKEIYRLKGQNGVYYGFTKFSDVADEELFPRHSRSKLRECKPYYNFCLDQDVQYIYGMQDILSDSPLPRSIDWRARGVVGPVLDQKQCKSSWAFSIVGLMESMAVIQNYEYAVVRRSVQELMDCFGSNGCQEKHVADALNWLCKKRWGVVTEKDYPLRLQNETCQLKRNIEGRRVKQYYSLCNVNEGDILRLLAYHGPVMAVVNVKPWKNYVKGVIQTNCVRGDPTTDQVVQIVGYDLAGDIPYYIVRSSWGKNFGNGGYVKLKYGDNMCGIADEIYLLDVY